MSSARQMTSTGNLNPTFCPPRLPICVHLRHLRITSDGVSPHLLGPAPAGLDSDRTDPSRENGERPSAMGSVLTFFVV